MSQNTHDFKTVDAFMVADARMSDDNLHRLWLSRVWDPELPLVHFIAMNASTADARRDDPSVRRMMGFAQDWVYGGFILTNVCSLRTQHPRIMLAAVRCGAYAWQQHQENLEVIEAQIACTAIDVIAWGADGAKIRFGEKALFDDVIALLAKHDRVPHALGVTMSGQPRHPLYVKRGVALAPIDYLRAEKGLPSITKEI